MNLQEQLSKFDGTEKMIEKCLEIVQHSCKVIIFGAGVGGTALYGLLKNNKLDNKIAAWADNNPLKIGNTYLDKRLAIVEPAKLIDIFGLDITILVASSAYDTICCQLIDYGFLKSQIVLSNFAFMDLDYTDKEFIWDHIEDFERAYAKLEDEKSKNIFVNILNYKITKDEKYLKMMQRNVDDNHFQYFDKEIYLKSPNEVFLDIGAYTGDTFEALDKIYDGSYEMYYGFEADDMIYEKLKETVEKSLSAMKTRLFNYAAWSDDTILYFEANAGSSRMEEKNDKTKRAVKAIRVDSILKDKKISFIKVDIEGAEANALRGMISIIRKNRPVLAICVYHLRDDFYNLTDLIEELLPGEYKYYFRQYRYTPTETVCYAVPKHRQT